MHPVPQNEVVIRHRVSGQLLLCERGLAREVLAQAARERISLAFADLSHLELKDTDLRGLILDHAKLLRADLRGCNLEGVSLKEATLVGAKLNGANFTGADLSQADLREVNAAGVIFRGARLSKARFGALAPGENPDPEAAAADRALGALASVLSGRSERPHAEEEEDGEQLCA